MDFKIRDYIQKAMINYLGFTAYTCLISFLLTFTEDSAGQLKLDLIAPKSQRQYFINTLQFLQLSIITRSLRIQSF